MLKQETEKLDYISKAFLGLSTAKKDTLLNTAKSLLEIQEKDVVSIQKEEMNEGQNEGLA